MTEKSKIELPKQVTKADRKNANSLILYGLPKCGKTTALSSLPNNLIIDVEKGTGFVDALKITPPEGLGPVATFNWLKDLAEEIKAQGKPYDYVSIDTFSHLDSLAEWCGTWRYMNSSQGKSFNREGGKAGAPMLKPNDVNYESVHSLPNGYGYQWSRNEIIDLYDCLCDLGKICTIFVAHVTDKYLSSKANQEVMTRDLALTGKVKDIIARKVDAIGYVYSEEGQQMISFKGNEEKIGGNRSKHIAGYEGPLDWNKIFINS